MTLPIRFEFLREFVYFVEYVFFDIVITVYVYFHYWIREYLNHADEPIRGSVSDFDHLIFYGK